ncbi:hypothetical protein L228DRAFT_239435 [Xylona heveae TC161]|uniref:Altered inheritance of mitochondria protein 6 n=1 Tax=Xylona heveae (strain CBS 132557 / TC161) TaxID=1328760 RepID=A0A165FW89_XYLHT|nr:hypothetical protein L228DRAFT_239435 [Xylona heveae TC161]KZF21456.1 hypothetical protein L228DRAFT_239435 [Xylona heveae TC161]
MPDQYIHMDLEHRGAEQPVRKSRVIRLWKIPLPLRKGQLSSDLLKNIAWLMTLLCVTQFAYIIYLQNGMIRVPNDPYDIRFSKVIDEKSPSIWDHDRQSFIRNALPVPVHSHNDYSRRIPLFEALGSGCISIEADIHLRNSDLLVGHTSASLQHSKTLRSMYLEPLQRMIEVQNGNVAEGTWRGLFNLAPHQTLVLLIDHKTSGPETFRELYTQLQPLRDLDYLTYWNGTERVLRPLTIVVSGSAPFESVTMLNETHRDIFWDANLEELVSASDNFDEEPFKYVYNASNSYFASTEFKNAVLYSYREPFTPPPKTPQMKDMVATQIEQARARGLMVRYWNTPSQPPNLREVVWRVLIERQVDILNMDDLGAVRARANGWGNIKT